MNSKSNESKNKDAACVTYTYSQVIESVEDGINIWDFASKYGLVLEKQAVKNILLRCTGGNEERANELFKILTSNSQSYIKKHVERNDKFNYDTLLKLAENGYTRLDVMKKFGKYSYSSFCATINTACVKANVSEEKKRELTVLLRNNIKPVNVTIIEPDTSTLKVKEAKEPAKKNDCINTSEYTKYSNKLVLYTIEYLHQQSDVISSELLEDLDDERVILSGTLTKYLKDQTVPESSKIKLFEAINQKRIGVLQATSEYTPKSDITGISLENDIILSQALMLSKHTDKQICIATSSPTTALNALMLGFSVRIPKNRITVKFSEITNNNLGNLTYYFDYNISADNKVPCCNSAIILDTCVILNNKCDINLDKILSDTTQLKILPRIVLDEIVEQKKFFSTLFAAKCNPTINIDLVTCLKYNFPDLAILNFAMYYQATTGKEVTILTHDKAFSFEALKYNMKVKYYPSTYIESFESFNASNIQSETIEESLAVQEEPSKNTDLKECETSSEDTIPEDEKDEIVYHETVPIRMVSSRPVILKSNKITCVKSGFTLEPIKLMGKKSMQYYPVELGDYISFKNDPNLYMIKSLTGRNNLESVDPCKIGVPYSL